MRVTALKDPDRGEKLWFANASDGPSGRYHRPNLYRMQFGASGTAFVLVWAHSFDDALEEAAGFCRDKGWNGLFCDDEYLAECYRDACEDEGIDPKEFPSHGVFEDPRHERALQAAEEDLTYTESGWIPSGEWYGDEIHDGPLYERAIKVAADLQRSEE